MQPKESHKAQQLFTNTSKKVNKKYWPSLKGSITTDEMRLIFIAKCQDFHIIPTPKLFERFLNHQSKKPFIKVFDMARCALGKGSAAILANILITKPLLKIVDISGNSIGDQGAFCFSKLISSSKNIISMNLSSNSITDEGSQLIFAEMTNNKHIISLNLGSDNGVGRNSIGAKSAQAIKVMLQSNNILSELDISMTEITCDMVTPIAQGIRQNSALQYFNISNNNIQSKGVNILLKACAQSKIKVLSMANNHIRDDSTQSFVNYITTNRNIETFDLSGNYLTKSFILGISYQLKSSSIVSLNLNNNPLKSEGIASLGHALNGECNMKYLSVVNCQIEVKGFVEFCDLISGNTSLVSLHLGHNSLLDEGAIRLSHVIKRHPSFKEIDLEMCEITQEGGKLLFAAFAQSQTIRRINIKNNLIHDGIVIQKCLNENPRIFYINTDYNTIEYKTSMEIQRLASENIKRWRSEQKNRVKDEVVKLAGVNEDLADARQSIIEEREFISILKNRIAESEEFQANQKVTNEKTNVELNDKYNQVSAVVNDYLLKTQLQKDELRSQANRRETEISNLSHKIENLGQSLKQHYIALQSVDHKITEIKKKHNNENDTLRIQYINAKNRYNDMKELFLEAWRKAQEEKRILQSAEKKKRQQEEALAKAAAKNKGKKGIKKKNPKDNESNDSLDTKRTIDSNISNESKETDDSTVHINTNQSNASIRSNLSTMSAMKGEVYQESERADESYESNVSKKKDRSIPILDQIDELNKEVIIDGSSNISEKASNKSTNQISQSNSVTQSGRSSSMISSVKKNQTNHTTKIKQQLNKNATNDLIQQNNPKEKSSLKNGSTKAQSKIVNNVMQSNNSKNQSNDTKNQSNNSKNQSNNGNEINKSKNISNKVQSEMRTVDNGMSPKETGNNTNRNNDKIENDANQQISSETSGVFTVVANTTKNTQNTGDANRAAINKNKLTPQSPKLRSQSQQGNASPLKKPKIVIPVPKVQQEKRNQVQMSPKQPLSYQSQVIPEPIE